MEPVARHLVRYLIGERLLEAGAPVDGRLVITIGRSRNRFALVQPREGGGYFLKQALGELMSARTVAREAEVYRLAFSRPAMAPLREVLAPFHRFDPKRGILVIGLIPEADSLTILQQRDAAPSPALALRVGAALAACHEVRLDEADVRPGLFARSPHWILLLHGGGDIDHLRRSPAASAVLDLILEEPGLKDRLKALRDGWTRDALIHGDIRWENCLLGPRSEPLEKRRLYIVDWELADIGDPAWDVAGMLQAYLNSWIISIPPAAPGTAEQLNSRAERPLAAIRPALVAFWEGYAGTRLADAERPAFLERAVALMAARMLVTAVEISTLNTTVDGRVLLILQTAFNILERPLAAAADLLGIDAHAPVPAPDREATPAPLAPVATHAGRSAAPARPEAFLPIRPFVDALRIADGQVSLAGAAVRPAPAQPDAAAQLLADLIVTVYERAYARAFPPEGAAPPDCPDLVERLAAANATRAQAQTGWRVVGREPDGSVVAVRHGRTRRLRQGEYSAALGASDEIVVAGRSGRADLQPGFYHCFGETSRTLEEVGALVRLYWNVTVEGAPRLVRLVTATLNRYRIPFEFKIADQASLYERRDAAVLYVAQSDFPAAALALQSVLPQLEATLAPGVPLFAKALAPGIGLAEEPGIAGESFGTARSRLVAGALVAARRGNRFPFAAFTRSLDEAARDAGLRPDALWLNPGSLDDYEFSQPHCARAA